MAARTREGYAGYLSGGAAAWPDRVALRFEGTSWTYAELQSAVECASAVLAAAGVVAGDRVGLLVDNVPQYLIAQFALARLGAAFVTPNAHWTPAEIARALEAVALTAVVYNERLADVAVGYPVAVPVDSLNDEAGPAPGPAVVESEGELFVPFSSGTTGFPKGVVHTQSSVCGAVEQLRHHLALTSEDRLPIALPLCHVFGTTIVAAALSVGAQLTLLRRFDLDDMLGLARAGDATIWPLAGAAAHQLAWREDLRAKDFRSLRFFMWGGSAIPVQLAEDITSRTGVRFLTSYGMTEAMAVAFNPVDQPWSWRLDSPGYPTLGTELRLGDNGGIEVRGPSVAVGYAGQQSPDFLPDGWFRTGDLGRVGDDGRLMIVDRIKDMIKVSGFQVAPVEVEQALATHPSVVEAAVVGRPDERYGEVPVAFVVPRAPLTTGELDFHLTELLATYKRPREYRFVEELPRTPGGKVKRSALRTAT